MALEIRGRQGRVVSEHNDTVKTLFFYKMEELRNETMGGYLEFVDEFVLAEGNEIEPHSHNTDEFYYVLDGNGTMTVDGEAQELTVGELVRIRPNLIHSLAADRGVAMRALAFAISYMPEDRVGYTAYPIDGREPHFVSTHYDFEN